MDSPRKKRQKLPLLHEEAEQLIAHFLPVYFCQSAQTLKELLSVYPLRYLRVDLSFSGKTSLVGSEYAQAIALGKHKLSEVSVELGQYSQELLDACFSLPQLKCFTLQCSIEASIPALEYMLRSQPCGVENVVFSLANSDIANSEWTRLVQLLLKLHTSNICTKLLAFIVTGVDLFTSGPEQSVDIKRLLAAPQLKTVNFRDLSISPAFIRPLAASLKGNNSKVVDLHICRCTIGDEGVILLSKALEFNATISGLALNTVEMSSTGATALAKSLERNNTVRYLLLRDDELGIEGGKALAKMLLVNKSLVGLKLQYVDLEIDGAAEFATVLKQNKTLKVLVLGYCNVSMATCKSLCKIAEEEGVLENFTYADFNTLPGRASRSFEAIMGKRLPCMKVRRLCYVYQAHISSYSLNNYVYE